MEIDISEIMKLIPHRYPFLLVDKVTSVTPNESIQGVKNVSINEIYFMGHFPSKPIMPGVLIIESMAQLSAILVSCSMSSRHDKEVYFMSIESTKFRKIVKPGDVMVIHSQIQQHRSYVWKFISNTKVDGVIVAESKFTAMVRDKEN